MLDHKDLDLWTDEYDLTVGLSGAENTCVGWRRDFLRG